ncbi:uncharacterized protein LOC123537436 [Mercenaria mercenaria]|uniref:uncharacterized protein LOC123537436 n=1 Tax=Mercenaria mercenaria TaxID=6596 RepID=UPI00234EF8EA|nr:uncharacterized protein LOC123537436 [Mercenaria mercenaria]
MARMVVTNLLLLIALVTIVHSFPRTTSNGRSPLDSVDVVVEDDTIEERLQGGNKAVTELFMEKNYHTEKSLRSDLLSTWISKGHLRDSHPLHRQRRQISSTRLKRLLATKKGKKWAKKLSKRKNLPIMLALIKRRKKLRERKLKEAERSKENKVNETKIASVVPVSSEKENTKNTPGSNNEINLTVQVDLHNPNEQNESIPNGNDNGISVPSLQGMHRSYPFASPRVQVPQGPNNVFGVSPQMNSPYQRGIVPDIYRGPNSEYQRSYPGLTGMLSGQKVMQNRAFLGPSFSDPRFNSVPRDKYYQNGPQTLDNQRASYPEENILSENIPNTQKTIENNSFRARSNEKLSDNFLSPSNNFPVGSQRNKVNADASSNRVDLQTEKSVNSATEIKDTTDENNGKNELVNLLKDIKSLVNNIKPQSVNDADTQLASDTLLAKKNINENMDTQISKTKSVSNDSTDIEDNEVVSSPKEIIHGKETEARLENNKISSPRVRNLSQQHKQRGDSGKGNLLKNKSQKSYLDRESDKEKKSLLTTGWKEAESIKNIKGELRQEKKLVEASELAAENPSISSKVIKDPDAMYKEKLSSLTSDDFIEILQNLKLISKREKKLIRRVSAKWKKNNNIQMVFKELMRRRYFRNAVNSLVEEAGMSNTNEHSNQNLIIALLKAEDQQSKNYDNENASDRAKTKINVNSIPIIGIFPEPKNQPNNIVPGGKSNPDSISFDGVNQPDNIVPDQENVNKHQPDNILAGLGNQSDNKLTNDEYKPKNTFVNKEHLQENIFSEDENQLDSTSSERKNQLNSIFSNKEYEPINVFPDQGIQADSSGSVGMNDNTSDQEHALGNMISDNEHQDENMFSDQENQFDSTNFDSDSLRGNTISNHVHQHDNLFSDHEH